MSQSSHQSSCHRQRRINQHPVHNRILALMAHTTRYAFVRKGRIRLAQDCGVSPSAINRVIAGQACPSFFHVASLATALEKQLGCTVDPRDIVSPDGAYPTPFVCAVVGCSGCLPDEFYDAEGKRRPEFEGIAPGTWSGNVPPRERQKAVRHSRKGRCTKEAR
jgi:hypothetical protein